MSAGEIPSSAYGRYQSMQRYVGWTEADASRVRSLRDLLEPGFEAIISDFYTTIQSDPGAVRVITGGIEQITRLKVTLHQWLEELFRGVYDEAYVMRRWRVGWRHVDIGLDQVFTNMALSRMRHRLLDALAERWTGSAQDLLAASQSLSQLLDLDLAIIEDAYQAEYVKRLQHSERLATIGKIGAGIAHELRNPLNVIRTSVYYLLHTRVAVPEKVAEHLARIERQVGTANAVITALSNFARLRLPEFKSIALRECLQEVIDESALPENVAVELSIDEEPLQIVGDRDQLRIVFSNLIRNACEALAEGGQIRITAALHQERIQVAIADNGCGISPDNLRHIAEPLFTTKARGLGLGLAISKAIVEKHGAEWRVASELGQGTVFTLRFPPVVVVRADA